MKLPNGQSDALIRKRIDNGQNKAVSSPNKTDRHDRTEILMIVALNTINQT
jgi:hypothetical protein